ncbi:MAG: hypothetical protein ABJN62_11375 [Halioglobus sp.]
MSEENTQENWKDSLPSALQVAPYFKNAESVDQVLADLNNAASWQGNSVKLPATDDDLPAFKEKLEGKYPDLFGIEPAAPDLSQYEPPEEYEAEASDELKAQAKELGLTQKQFDKLLEVTGAQEEAQQQWAKDQHQELTEKYGLDRDSVIQQAAATAASTGAPESVVNLIEQGTDASLVNWMASIQGLASEQAVITHDVTPPVMADPLGKVQEIDAQLMDKSMVPGSDEYSRLISEKVKVLTQL